EWRPQQIRYSYTAFTTAYDCDAAAAKLKDILTTLGAHPQTQVRATGCNLNRPSRMFFISITTATPVAVGEDSRALTTANKSSEQALIEKLGGKSAVTEPFGATWQTIDLSADRKLDLQPGDCELMEGLRNHVLPKIGDKVINDRVQCFPNTLSINTPRLEVSALVPVGDAAAKQRA